jgi:mRNA-degrading endonuclease RelE of RelBE toxin-antitoxin system
VPAYEVELTARARKQYKALDPAVRDRIRRALLDTGNVLGIDPTAVPPRCARPPRAKEHTPGPGRALANTPSPLPLG